MGAEVLSFHMRQKANFMLCKNHKPHLTKNSNPDDDNVAFYLNSLPHM